MPETGLGKVSLQTPCEDLPPGATCITGMLYTDCMDSSCWNENCTYVGNCTDSRHEKNKEEK